MSLASLIAEVEKLTAPSRRWTSQLRVLLRHLTGDDHGPWFVDVYPGQAPCPACFESSGYAMRIVSATWYEPSYAEPDPTRRCEECNGTGTVDSPLATLDDLEELAFEEAASRAALAQSAPVKAGG